MFGYLVPLSVQGVGGVKKVPKTVSRDGVSTLSIWYPPVPPAVGVERDDKLSWATGHTFTRGQGLLSAATSTPGD